MKEDLISLIDMDGTICDYDAALLRDLNLMKSPEEPQIIDLRSGEKTSHIGERMKAIKRSPNWWLNLEPIPSGMRLVHHMDELGFKIHILTQGPANTATAWTEKVQWCKKHLSFIDYDITITRNKGIVYGKVLFDDYPEYAQKWLKWRPRGLVIMPLRDYNRDFSHPNVYKYDGSPKSFSEVSELLKDIKNNDGI